MSSLPNDVHPLREQANASPGFIRRWVENLYNHLPGGKLRSGVEVLLAVTEPTRNATVGHQPIQTHPRACGEISVLSSNLCHDWPKYRRFHDRLEQFARLAEDVRADIILVQEIARTPYFKTDDWLANRLGMAYVYTRANGHERAGFEEGLGIFSRFPLGEPLLRQMSGGFSPFVRRLALGAPVKTPCGDLLAFSVHLSLIPLWNRLQLGQIFDWIGRIDGGRASLVGGDFNTSEHTSQIRRIHARWKDTFRQLHPHADATTHEFRWPWGHMRRTRLDYIFLSPGRPGWEIKETLHLENPYGSHSDHRAVLTRLAPVPVLENVTP